MSTINLLPDDYIRGRVERRANALCLVLFFVVMGGVVGAYLVCERSYSYAQDVRTRLEQDYREAERLIAQMRELEQEKQRLQAKALATASLMERVPRSALLGVITKALPEHTSLKDFELETREMEVASSSKSRKSKFSKVAKSRADDAKRLAVTMKITGLAPTDVEVARLIANLARNPLTHSVDLVYSEETIVDKKVDDRPVREFQVRVALRHDADAIEIVGEPNNAPAADAPPA
jgi:Tfp pilus assembly protein PilN